MFCILMLIEIGKASECGLPSDCESYCRVYYKGEKNFYNSTDGDCYEVPQCESNKFYDMSTNECISQPQIPRIPDSNSTESSNSTTNSDKQGICLNGHMQENACICEDGWYTSTYQDPSQPIIYFCNTQTPQNFSYSQGENGGLYLNSQQPNKAMQIPLSPLYKILILLLGVLVCFIPSCCYIRHLKKRANFY